MLAMFLVLLPITLSQLYTNTSFSVTNSDGTVKISAFCFSGATGIAPTVPYHWTQIQPNGSILIGYGFNQNANYVFQVLTNEECRAGTQWSMFLSTDEQTFVPI